MVNRSIPDGIQKLLALAAEDMRFREEFAADPVGAARAAGVPLTVVERAILEVVPAAKISEMAERMLGPPAPRLGWVRPVARTAFAALSAGLISQAAPGCGSGEVIDSAPLATAIEPAETGPAPAAPAADPEIGDVDRRYRIRGPMVMPCPRMAREPEIPLDILEAMTAAGAYVMPATSPFGVPERSDAGVAPEDGDEP